MANSLSYLVVGAMSDDDNVLGELQPIGLETDPESVRPLKKLAGFVSFEPYLPGMDRALSGESRMRAPPEGAQSCLNDGRDTLDEIRVFWPIILCVLVLEGLDLLPEIAHAGRRRENGGTGRSCFILWVGRNLQETEAAGVEALRHEGFVWPRLDL